MDDEIKPEKYRKLSVAALVTGILAYFYALIFFTPVLPFIGNLIKENFFSGLKIFGQPVYEILPLICGFVSCFGLPIAAVICGSIDLKRIKAGLHIRKGRGFDIAGIVLGGLFILLAVWIMLGEILIPH